MAQRNLPWPAFGVLPALPSLLQARAGLDPETLYWAPQKRLAHLHDPVIVADLWRRLIGVVRQPARVCEVDGRRVVLVTGIAAVTREPDGSLSLDVWRDRGDGRLRWVRSEPYTVVLQAMPAGWAWLDLIRDAAMVELERHLCQVGVAFDREDLRTYARDLFAHLRRRLVRNADLRWMRRRVAAALALDADAVRIARRVIEVRAAGAAGRMSAYNAVVRHLQAFKMLERELPQAIPLYAAFVERQDFPRHGEPAQALRAFLRLHDLSPRLWRLIASAGPRLALPLRDFYIGDAGTAMLDYLRIADALGLRREPPAWLMWAILSRVGNPASRYQAHWPELRRVASLFGHAARVCVDVRPAPVDDLPHVLEWLAEERPQLDKLQRRAGWLWLVGRAREWMALRRLEIEAEAVSWSTPFVRMPMGAYEMVALRSVRELWDEARAMHHCVDGYAARCAAGDVLVVAVRSGSNPDRRVATALFERKSGRWELDQVRSVANRCPPPDAEAAVVWFCGVLNAPGGSPPEMEVDAGAHVGAPPEGKAPRHMPPNARLVVEVAWSWSPMHSRRLRYFISGNRDGSLWLLWQRHFDDNYGRWERNARLVAYAGKRDVPETVAAARMLAACWRREMREEEMDEFHQVLDHGVVDSDELERVAKELWGGRE